MQRLYVAYNFGCRALYNLPWRASVRSHEVHCNIPTVIGVARGVKRAMAPPTFLENIVFLCFERRFSIQNGVIRLKSNILAPPNFWAGYATTYRGGPVTKKYVPVPVS